MTWSDNENEDTTIYNVVINHEEQYSIWPADRENAPGWQNAGRTGSKAECLAYIKEVWTDMRPLSLRKRMEELARNPLPIPDPPADENDSDRPHSDDLVQRLSKGSHAVEASLRPEKTLDALKECIDRGYVHLKFTGTRGGTELGVALERDSIAFDESANAVRLAGGLTLNYVKVRCIANLDLNTLAGQGHLERI
jgi:uncharacterized protein YbdZ (MbtH family)